MSIFPDNDKRRKQDDLAGEDPARPDYPDPKPNPPHAFQGGTVQGKGRVKLPGAVKFDAPVAPVTPTKQAKNPAKGLKQDKRMNPKAGQNRKFTVGGCFVSVMILGGILAGVGAVFFFVIAPMFGWFNPFGEDTREVPGDAAAFDPMARYAEIAAYAQDEAAEVSFVDMSAYYVKSDGTLDLTTELYLARVEWEFFVPSAPPENAPPVGAGGSLDDSYFREVTIEAFRPGQLRTVSTTSGGSRTTYTYKHLGLERETSDPSNRHAEAVPAPECSFKTLWDIAIQNDAPRNAVAIITYNGEIYDFRIQDTNFDFEFNRNCRLIR